MKILKVTPEEFRAEILQAVSEMPEEALDDFCPIWNSFLVAVNEKVERSMRHLAQETAENILKNMRESK
jgi:hypothetical protein